MAPPPSTVASCSWSPVTSTLQPRRAAVRTTRLPLTAQRHEVERAVLLALAGEVVGELAHAVQRVLIRRVPVPGGAVGPADAGAAAQLGFHRKRRQRRARALVREEPRAVRRSPPAVRCGFDPVQPQVVNVQLGLAVAAGVLGKHRDHQLVGVFPAAGLGSVGFAAVVAGAGITRLPPQVLDEHPVADLDAVPDLRGHALPPGRLIQIPQGGFRLLSLADFPRGSCGDVSELLGQYLSDSGLGAWSYPNGTQSDPFFTHAWVERDGLIVDITADQFPDTSEPVLLTTDRTWHDARFPSGPSSKAANLDWFELNINRADALADYDTLKRRADALR